MAIVIQIPANSAIRILMTFTLIKTSIFREIKFLIFSRPFLFGRYKYQADFGWIDNLPEGKEYRKEETITVGAEYFLSKNFSLVGSYDNLFGAGAGLSIRV